MNDSERLALVDWFERALNYAMQPTRQGEGDDAERMARRMAAVLIVDRATALGMPEAAVDELRQEFRKVHPGIFPETQQH